MVSVAPRNHKEFMKTLRNKAALVVNDRKENLQQALDLQSDPDDVWKMKQYLHHLKDIMRSSSDEVMIKIDFLRKELEAYNIAGNSKLGTMKELYLQEMKEIEVKGLKDEFSLLREVKKRVDELTNLIDKRVDSLNWKPDEWPWRKETATSLQDLELQYKTMEANRQDDDLRLAKAAAILKSLTESYRVVENEVEQNITTWDAQRAKLIAQRDNCNFGRINGSHLLVEHRSKEKALLEKISYDRDMLRVGNVGLQGTNMELNDSFGALVKQWNSEARDMNLNQTIEIERLTAAINEEMKAKKVLSTLKYCAHDIEELFRKKKIADETFEMHFATLIVALRSHEKLNKKNIDAFLGEIKQQEELMRNTHFVLENQVENFENLVARDPASTIPALAGHNNIKVLIQKYDRFITAYANGFSFYL